MRPKSGRRQPRILDFEDANSWKLLDFFRDKLVIHTEDLWF